MIISPAFEYMAYENRSPLKALNPLIKTLLLLIYLFLNLWLNGFYCLVIFALSLLFFLLAKIPLGYVKRALLMAFFVAFVLFTVRLFFWKERNILETAVASIRIITGVMFILTYVATTTLNEMLSALRKMRVPEICLETFLVIYKYIFIINDDGLRLKNAQMMRMGYSNFSTSLRSMGALWGALFLRSVGKAEKVVDALNVRGYKGTIYYPTELSSVNSKDILIFMFGLAPLILGLL